MADERLRPPATGPYDDRRSLWAEIDRLRAEVERLTELRGCCLDECPAKADAETLAEALRACVGYISTVVRGLAFNPGTEPLALVDGRAALRQHEERVK